MISSFDGKMQVVEVRRQWHHAIDLEEWDRAHLILDQIIDDALLLQPVGLQRDLRPYFYHLKGSTFEKCQQWALAIKWYKRSLRLDPQSASTLSALSRVLQQAGNPKLAERYLSKMGTSIFTAVRRWREAVESQEFDEALLILDQLLMETHHLDAEQQRISQCIILLWKSTTYDRSGQLRMAIKMCVRALRVDSQNQDAWHHLGKLLQKAHKPIWAKRCLHK